MSGEQEWDENKPFAAASTSDGDADDNVVVKAVVMKKRIHANTVLNKSKKTTQKSNQKSNKSFIDSKANDSNSNSPSSDGESDGGDYESFDERDTNTKTKTPKRDDDNDDDDKFTAENILDVMSSGGTSNVLVGQENFTVPNSIKDMFQSDQSIPEVLQWMTLVSPLSFAAKRTKEELSASKNVKKQTETQKETIRSSVTSNVLQWAQTEIKTVADLHNAEKLIRGRITATSFASALVLHVGRNVTNHGKYCSRYT
jgi:hypothetical protein